MMITNSGFSQLCPNLVQNPGFNWVDNPNDADLSNDFTIAPASVGGLEDKNAFFEGEVGFWYPTGGSSPDIHQTNGTSGTNCAKIGSVNSNPVGEGFAQNVTFIAGQRYNIFFQYYQISNTTDNFLRIRLGNGQVYTTGFQEIFKQNLNFQTLTSVSFCFTPNATYSGIEFLTGTSGSASWCFIDDVNISTFDINVTGPTNVCLGSNFTLNDNVPCNPLNVTYQWYQVVGVNDIVINGATTANYVATATTLGSNTFKLVKTINSINGSCSISQNFSFNVIGTAVSITGPGLVCMNAPFTLTALAQAGSTYAWSPTNLTTSSINQSINNQTTYTCTIVKDGCTYTVSKTVNVLPLPNVAITGASTVCEGSSITLSSPMMVSYKWYNTDDLNTILATSQSFTTTPTVSPTSYRLVVSDDNGCTNSVTKTITFENDCNCGTQIGLGGTLSGTFSNGVYRINNDVTISGTVNFTNIEVKIAPGKKIILNPNAQLLIKGSHLYACSDMWQGIEMKSDSKIKIEDYAAGTLVKSSLIEDAIIAINLDPQLITGLSTAQVFLNNVTFNRNKTAVRLLNQTGSIFFNQSKIENCVFTSRNLPKLLYSINTMTWVKTNDLRIATNPFSGNPHTEQYISQALYPIINLKAPNSSQMPTQCIYLENIKNGIQKFNLGNAANFNIFDFANILIYVKNSNLNIRGNFFQNTTTAGYGIYALETRSNFNQYQNKMDIWFNTFVNCHYAINSASYSDLSISLNKIRSNQKYAQYNQLHPGSYGFNIISFKFNNYEINRNYFYNIKEAITFYGTYFSQNGQIREQFANELHIFGNEIHRNMVGYDTECYATEAIKVLDIVPGGTLINSGQTANFTITIKANILDKVFRGIQCNSWKANRSIVVTENVITLMQNSLSGGQYYGIDFNDNLIAPGLNNKIYLNTVTGFSSALTAWTMPAIKLEHTQGTNVICNTLSTTEYGLYFSHTNPNTNTILNNMNNHAYGFVLDNSGIISQQGNSTRRTGNKFTANTRKTACLNGSNATQSKMYVRNVLAENPNMSSLELQGSIKYAFPSSISYTSAFPGTCEQYQSPQQPNNQLLDQERESMRKIINHEIVFEPNPLESEHIAKEQIFTVLKMNSHLMDNEAVLQAFFAQEEQGNNGKLKRTLDFIENGQLLDAQNEINAMSITHPIDYNNQRFYDIYLNYLNDSLDVVDSLDLITLGNKCPHLDGSIVFQARSLFGLIYGSDYLFAPTCDSEIIDTIEVQGMMISGKDYGTELPSQLNELDVLLYPNPSKTSISLTAENIASFQVTIIDQQGRIIPFEKEIKHQNLVQIQHTLDKGFYTILIDNGHQKLSKKLVIE